jgi:hypothetical protein
MRLFQIGGLPFGLQVFGLSERNADLFGIAAALEDGCDDEHQSPSRQSIQLDRLGLQAIIVVEQTDRNAAPPQNPRA